MTSTRTLLAEHPFLDGLAPSSLDRLTAWAHPVYRNLGHRLFTAGRPALRFWLLRTGRVALDLNTPGRGDVVIETLEPGSVLGWSWLFPPRQWQFGAVAVEPVRAIEFNAAGVRHLMADDPELGYELTGRFMAVMLDRLQATRTRLLDLYGYPELQAS
ncbi:cyclic nucleotide-binding domain-containing protein [Phytohabitans sp. ZYX-F-186]|uniref:Cyclic nucleotide-binding domain-containing protein n=1 Tax=Phytohabitans maris TaxID=3071409 RepID=A0ABU0ZT91_9ACTN|nr:cyclic nucleotide-binding domain-containing protein [Phytohabitans sp. ZYX-F-186]MDQ7910178.1 cyclic nucleotide-binding domain-containing protein [Phytohabitans sp. ZYX-F-186]